MKIILVNKKNRRSVEINGIDGPIGWCSDSESNQGHRDFQFYIQS